VTVDDTVRYF